MRPSTLLIAWLLCPGLTRGADDPAPPQLRDDDLRITLFAMEPEIVTPIGIAVDRHSRVFVVESHTHMPDRDYPGPDHDRIRMLLDTNGDGRADRVTTFADGFRDAMNLALSPDGELYVCHRTGVVLLHDRDGDGVSEARTDILSLETRQSYSHSCLLGVKFSPDGWLYVSRGNVAGYEYTIRGSDGATVAGYRDGGNLVRCRPDGSQLEEVATGFWNPFDMDFDRQGRLLLCDNDPDSRGPNRLVHVIPGGDYGFKSHYGPSGLHPFNAWNGERPGTLPMIAATGEAPSGVLDCERAALPERYRGSVLVTSWGAHAIELFRLQARGASLAAAREVLVEGDALFRPVGIAAGPDGAIYVTDWVRKDYPNHGQGRIWRIAPAPGANVMQPRQPFAPPEPDAPTQRLDRLLSLNAPEHAAELTAALADADPFVRAAAVTSLARPASGPRVRAALHDKRPRVRLGALLALRRAGHEPADDELRRLLEDPSVEVRTAALMWTAESRRKALVPDLERAVTTEPVTADLLGAYLAARQLFSPREWNAWEQRTPGFRIRRDLDRTLVDALVLDSSKPPALTALALALVREPDRPDRPELLERLLALAASGDPSLRREAIRTLAASHSAQAIELLEQTARDRRNPVELRADAVHALAGRPAEVLAGLLPLLDDPARPVQVEVLRALRGVAATDAAVREALERKLAVVGQDQQNHQSDALDLREQLEFALSPPGTHETAAMRTVPRPHTVDGWFAALADGGDPDAGRRVFFDAALKCANCHRVHGRGAGNGPDVSAIGRTADRRRLIESLLRPSDEIAPEFQGHVLQTTDGRVLSGIQFHFRDGGQAVSLIVEDGREIRMPLDEIEHWQASDKSLMPDGLEQQMTVGDFRDLLAFLESLK